MGMIRLSDLPISTIGDAAKKAVEMFDRSGAPGAKARLEYALASYILVTCIGTMPTCIREISDSSQSIEFVTSREAMIGQRSSMGAPVCRARIWMTARN